MVRHIFYIPASYTALIYGIIASFGLLLSLFVGLCTHREHLLRNACGRDHYEFWPSISSVIGDFIPERQIWRAAFVLCAPFRFGATILQYSVFWQNACGGMQDVYALLSSPRQFLRSSAFLVLLMFWSDVSRLIGAIVWTMVSSSENFLYHNLGFGPYIAYGFLLQIALTVLVRRNQFNLAIYESQRDAQVSLKLKRWTTFGQTTGALGVLIFNTYHKMTCYNGTYSLSTMSEWTFALCNVMFDATTWYELKKVGWWISEPPRYYTELFRTLTGTKPASCDVNAPASALSRGAVGGPADEVDAEDPAAVAAGAGTNGFASTNGHVSVRVRDTLTGVALEAPNGALSSSATLHTTLPHLPSASGEYFLTHDTILHRFTFCCAPSGIHMWLCDIYWAHLSFEMMVHLVQHMYFMPLIAMSLSWEIAAVLVLGTPCLFRLQLFRRWATGPCPWARTLLKPSHIPDGMHYRVVPMYVLFYFFASLSHLHMLIEKNDRQKILGVAFGPLFLMLGIVSRYMYPSTACLKSTLAENNEDSRRMIYAFPLGLVLGMLQRICYVGAAPMFIEPFYAAIFGLALGIAFTTTIYRHAMFGNAVKENSAVAAGTSMGARGEGVAVRADAAQAALAAASPTYPNTGSESDTDSPLEYKRRVKFNLGADEEAANNTLVALALAYPTQHPYHLGVIMGLLTSLSLTFFTSANYIPRLVAVDPYPASLLVVAAFAAGLYYSVDVIPICAPIMTARHPLGFVSRQLQAVLRQSWARFGVLFLASTVTLLFATRQTNFTYEKPHEGYPVSYSTPREKVLIKDWGVQTSFRGSKHLALAGGLGIAFCVGALYPVALELCFVHQRTRRFALLAESADVEQGYRRESAFFTSFECSWFTWTVIPSVLYALCISYPFVPMASIVRERSRSLILCHTALLYASVYAAVRRMRNTKSTLVPNTGVARKQRSLHRFVALLIVFAFGSVIIGRTVLQPDDVSYPEGKTTALDYQDEVLRLHEMLLKLRVARNVVTDPLLKEHEKTYHTAAFTYAMEEMGRNVTAEKASDVDRRYGLGELSQSVRADIWEAAKAMTFFSGLIWTVHFALDNFNVDSLHRMYEHAKATEAGVVGLLESDSMHLTNGNRDMVEYLSYYLGYRYTDYGPTALDNTYGCAIISRYPIVNVRRYVMPSPLGELACMIHAVLDVYGVRIHTYVAHFGNTEHFADGLLQSQFLGQTALSNPGPSLWLGYLVTFPGDRERYHQYTDPTERGKFRDTALEVYGRRPWVRLYDRGGYEEEPPVTITASPGEPIDFNVEAKLNTTYHLEKDFAKRDRSFRRLPKDKPQRYFYFNETNRYSIAHPRFEFVDRYCQYILYKTGTAAEELPSGADSLQPYTVDLFDWWRLIDGGVEHLSDTEIQIAQLRFRKRVA